MMACIRARPGASGRSPFEPFSWMGVHLSCLEENRECPSKLSLPPRPPPTHTKGLSFSFCSLRKAAPTGSQVYTHCLKKVLVEVPSPTHRLLGNKGCDGGAAALGSLLTAAFLLNLSPGAAPHLWLS